MFGDLDFVDDEGDVSGEEDFLEDELDRLLCEEDRGVGAGNRTARSPILEFTMATSRSEGDCESFVSDSLSGSLSRFPGPNFASSSDTRLRSALLSRFSEGFRNRLYSCSARYSALARDKSTRSFVV